MLLRGSLWVLSLLLWALPAAAVMPSPQGAQAPAEGRSAFEQVLQERCTGCHSRERIDQARLRGDAVERVLQTMIARGAVLSRQEQAVVGTFWGSPLKEPAPVQNPTPAVTSGSFSEYRQVIETRCLLCHTRERIDQAIAKQLPFQTVEAVLIRRGVVLTERETQVLKIFWGTPLSP